MSESIEDNVFPEDGSGSTRKKDSTSSKLKKDSKKDKKDKGYIMFEEEDSAEELFSDSNPIKTKSKKSKAFKFPKKDDRKEKKDKIEKDRADKKEKSERKKHEDKEKKHEKEKDSKKDYFETPKQKWGKKSNKLEESVSVEPEETKAIFGVPLATSVERNPSHDGIQLPAVVRECIDYISEFGLGCEGIYRISGVKSKVTYLKELYNMGSSVYLMDEEPNVVASLLKLFLRELPEPVLTLKLIPKFEQASTIKNVTNQVEQFIQLIQELPIPNKTLLSWVIVHMTQVIAKEKVNKMSLQNVSIVLSPTMKISHRVLNVFFTYSMILFKDTVVKKYIPPMKAATSIWNLELPESPVAIEEELKKQESLLNHLHDELMNVKDQKKEEQLWEVQRVVTQLKRKLKNARQMQLASSKTTNEIEKKKTPSFQRRLGTDIHVHSSLRKSMHEQERLETSILVEKAEELFLSDKNIAISVEKNANLLDKEEKLTKTINIDHSYQGKKDIDTNQTQNKLTPKEHHHHHHHILAGSSKASPSPRSLRREHSSINNHKVKVEQNLQLVTTQDQLEFGKVSTKKSSPMSNITRKKIAQLSKEDVSDGVRRNNSNESVKSRKVKNVLENTKQFTQPSIVNEQPPHLITVKENDELVIYPNINENALETIVQSSNKNEISPVLKKLESSNTNSVPESSNDLNIKESLEHEKIQKVINDISDNLYTSNDDLNKFINEDSKSYLSEKKIDVNIENVKQNAEIQTIDISNNIKYETLYEIGKEAESVDKIDVQEALDSDTDSENSSAAYTDVLEEQDDEDDVSSNTNRSDTTADSKICKYIKLDGDDQSIWSSTADVNVCIEDKNKDNNLSSIGDTTISDTSTISSDGSETEEHQRDYEKLLHEYNYLMMQEEELLTIGDELRQKIANERNEMERLQQDISELQMMRRDAYDDSSADSMSRSSSSDSNEEDEELGNEELKEMFDKLVLENKKLEIANSELCEKIHQERLICIEVKVQNRMIQQKNIESLSSVLDLITDQESLI